MEVMRKYWEHTFTFINLMKKKPFFPFQKAQNNNIVKKVNFSEKF